MPTSPAGSSTWRPPGRIAAPVSPASASCSAPPLADSAPSPLLAAVLLAIDLAADWPALAAWSDAHRHVLARLTAAEVAIAVSAQHRRRLEIDMARQPSLAALGAWWSRHQPDLHALAPADRALAIAAKNRAKAAMGSRVAA